MKVDYRDFEIYTWKAPGKYGEVQYRVTRISDGFCIADGVDEGTRNTEKDYIEMMKKRIDDYHEHPGNYEDED